MSKKILLEHINIQDLTCFDIYSKHGGYTAVEKALKTMSPEAVVEEVRKSGLRGRGGAGFPTGIKWNFIDKSSSNPRYLILSCSLRSIIFPFSLKISVSEPPPIIINLTR